MTRERSLKRIIAMLLAFLMMTAMLPASADDVVKTNITSYTAPTAVSDFEESLEPQPVVNAGTAEGGTTFYRLGLDGTWSDTVPTATTAATYTVYWYVKGDETHNDLGSETAPMGSATVQQGHNDKVKFNVKSSGFNINLFYAKDEATAGSWIQTTFGDRGYSTVVKVGENAQKDLSSFAFGKAYTIDGVEIAVNAEIPPGSEAVSVNYDLKNTTNEDVTVQIASHADTMMGSNDSAHIYIENEDTIVMEDNRSSSTTYGARYKITSGLGAFSSMWYGAYGSRTQHLFDSEGINENFSGDSGVAWSWCVNVPAGEEENIVAGGDIGNVNSQSIRATGITAAYGDTDKAISAQLTKGDGEISYAVTSGTDVVEIDPATGALTILKPGTAVVAITASETENFERTTKTVPVRISKRDVTLDWIDTQFVYDGEPHAPTANVVGLLEGDECEFTATDAKTLVGSYTSASRNWILSNDNYKVSSDITSVPFSIDKRELVLNWSGTEMVYNTQEQCPEVEVENFAGEDTCTATVTGAQTECGEYEVTAEISGLDESKYVLPETLTHSFKILPAEAGLEILPVTQKTFGDDSFTLETVKATDSSEIAYSVSDESVITVDENGTVTIVGAGTAVIKAETAATKNYKAGEAELELTVDKKASVLTVTELTCRKMYGDEPFRITDYKAEGEGEISVTVEDKSVADIGADGSIAIKSVGTTNIVISMAETANYKAVSESVKLIVDPKPITIAIHDMRKVYGEEDPEPEFDVTGLVEGDTLALDYDRDVHEDAGEHTLTPFVENEKRYVVTEAKEGVLTIERAPQVFTVLNNEFTYGDSDNVRLMRTNSKQTVSYAYKDGERTDVVELDAFGNIKPLRAGNTVIVAAAAETKNWLPGYMEIPVTVAPITVKFDWSGTSYTYDGAEHIPQLTVTGMINGDKCDAVLSGAETNAGSYTARALSLTNDNYAMPENDTADFVIKKADAGLKCGAAAVKFGDPSFALDIEKKTNAPAVFTSSNEQVAVIDENGVITIKSAGSTVITAAVAENENYLGAQCETELSVAKKEGRLFVDTLSYSKTYGDEKFAISDITSDGEAPVVFTSSDETVAAVDENGVVTIIGAGEAEIVMKTAESGNYLAAECRVKLTAAPKAATITALDAEKTFGEDDPAFEYQASGLVNGDTADVTFVRENGENAGEYAVTPQAADNRNYTFSFVSSKLTIKKAEQTVTAEDITLTQGDENVYVNAAANGGALSYSVKSGDAVTVDGSGRLTAVKPGTSVITVTAAETDNYNAAAKDITVTVKEKQHVVKFVTNSDDSIEDVTTTGSVSQPAALEKEGYVFEGWFTDASCTNAFDFSAPVTQDVTLYAKWTEKKPDTPVIDPEPEPEPELIGRVGDLDGDGFVTSTDALTALRISVESEEADDVLMLLADVDGDGYVTSGDAFAILRYSVELSSSENILKEIYK